MEHSVGWATINGNIISSKDKEAYGTLTTLNASDIYYGIVEIKLKNPNNTVAGTRYKIIPFSAYNVSTINEIDVQYNAILSDILSNTKSIEGSLYYTKPFISNESCVIRYGAGDAKTLDNTIILIIDKNIKTDKIVSISAEYKGPSIEMGETWDPEDLFVVGIYPNGETSRINTNGCIINPTTIQTVGSNNIDITLNDVDNGTVINQWKTNCIIPGIKKIIGLNAIYDGPEVALGKGPLNRNIIVTASYSDNTSLVVTDWVYEDGIDIVTTDNKGVFSIVYKNTQKCILTVPYYETVSDTLSAFYNGPNVEIGQSIESKYLKVKIHYLSKNGGNNDTWEELPQESYTIQDPKIYYEGNNVLTVIYQTENKTIVTTFVVYGIRPEKKLVFIEAEYKGPKITIGQAINTEKIICRGHYSDNTISTIKNFTVSNLIIDTLGQNILQVTYKDQTCDITIIGVSEEATTQNNEFKIKMELNYPNMTMVNHRYRGPIESYKLDLFNQNLVKNINQLYDIYESLEEQFNDLCDNLQKTKNIGTDIINECNKIKDCSSFWNSRIGENHE